MERKQVLLAELPQPLEFALLGLLFIVGLVIVKQVLEHPDSISKTLLGKALDSNTAFEILSIDIAVARSV